MNPTRLLERFFNRYVVPLGHTLQNDQIDNLNRDNRETETFYISGPFGPAFMDARSDQLPEQLKQTWLNEERSADFSRLIHPTMILANKLYEREYGEVNPISETSYVMY